MEQNRFDAIRAKTQEVLAKAKELYGVDIKPSISFELKGRVAGWAGCKHCMGQRLYTLRFNRDMIMGKHFEDILNETVAHEVAHLCCYADPRIGRKHDMGWKMACIALGGNGKTRHDYEVIYAGGGWDYMTDLGHKVTVSNVIHKKIQAGQGRRCRKRGRFDRYSLFCKQGQTMPTTPANVRHTIDTFYLARNPAFVQAPVQRPVQATVQQPKVARTISYADQVREMIRSAKILGQDQKAVIRGAEALGMKPSSARNCVKTLWDKV